MLAFFVMIFSVSTMNAEKRQELVSRLAAPIPQEELATSSRVASQSMESVKAVPVLPLGYLGRLLREKVDQDTILRQAIIVPWADRVFVSSSAEALFGADDATLTDDAREALRRLSGVFETIGNRIDIYGRTPPVRGVQGANKAWRLSLEWADAVANELKRIGIERNITILGLGQSRYKHLHSGLAAARRSGLAHRVDIVIHPTKEEP